MSSDDASHSAGAALSIAPLTESEIEHAVALWERAGLTRPWNDPYRDATFAMGKANSEVLVGKLDGAIMASVMVGHDGHRGAMYYVAVCPRHQGRGYGRIIVTSAERWLRQRGVWKVNLLVRNENVRVLAFYAGLGYVSGDTAQIAKRLDE